MVRTILITGANKGIGLAIARRCLLDHEDTKVILACRSVPRGRSAAASLVDAGDSVWRSRVSVLELDVASEASVARAAAELRASSTSLYAVCNNAGTATGPMATIFETNARGARRVSEALVPLVERGGRVVMISSGVAPSCVAKCTDERTKRLLCGLEKGAGWDALDALMCECEAFPNGVDDFEAHGIGRSLGTYGLSKAVLNAYTRLLQEAYPNLRVNACTPGMINTDLLRDAAPWYVPGALVPFLARTVVGALPVDEATKAPLFLLFGDPPKDGAFYGSDAERSPIDRYRKPGTEPFEDDDEKNHLDDQQPGEKSPGPSSSS